VQFAELDLKKLRGSEWSKLRDNVAQFTSLDTMQLLDQGLSGARRFERISGAPNDLTVALYANLQSEVRQILTGVVDTREFLLKTDGSSVEPSITLHQIRITLSYFLKPSFAPFNDASVLCTIGSEKDLFLFALLSFLSRHPTNRLERCPECNRIFVRIRKQRYCDKKCVNRVNARTYRQTSKGGQKNRARAAAHYEKKVRVRSPNARIKRRSSS